MTLVALVLRSLGSLLWAVPQLILVGPLLRWPQAVWRRLWNVPYRDPRWRLRFLAAPWLLLAIIGGLDVCASTFRNNTDSNFRPMRKLARAVGTAQDEVREGLLDLPWKAANVPVDIAYHLVNTEPGFTAVVHLLDTAGLVLLLFLFSTMLGGPGHVLLLRFPFGAEERAQTVNGAPMRRKPPSGFARARKKADKRGEWFVGKSLQSGKPRRLGAERGQHTWIVGSTGAGKTVSALLPALRAEILAGNAVVLVDGKAEPETAEQLAGYAGEAGRLKDFRYFNLSTPEQSATYSPLVHGDETEKKDKLIAAFEWSEEHYKKRSEEVALHLLAALEDTGKPYCLDDVRMALSSIEALQALGKQVRSPRVRRNLERLGEDWKEVYLSTCGLRTDLGLITESRFRGLFHTYRPEIDFWRTYRRQQIVYLGLPTLRYPETAARLARIMLSDIKTVAAKIQAEVPSAQRQQMTVAIDEFGSFAFEEFGELINKARSAKIGLILAHQSLSGDLLGQGEEFLRKIVNNTNVKICLRQDDPNDAEYFARLGGTHTTHKRTTQVGHYLNSEHETGMGSDREVEQFNLNPNIIKALPTGHAALVCGNPRWVDVVKLDYPKPSESAPVLPPPRTLPDAAPPGGICLHARANGNAPKPRRSLPKNAPGSRREGDMRRKKQLTNGGLTKLFEDD